MSRLAWMRLFVSDTDADTAHLSNEELGAYMRLVFHYWKWKSLPTSNKKLASIARVAPSEWLEIKASLQPFFDSEWRSERLEREIADAEKRHATACRMNGQRWGNKSVSDSATDSVSDSVGISKPQPQPQPDPQPYPQSQPDFGLGERRTGGEVVNLAARARADALAWDDDDDILAREIPF